jgi:uncharacterized protein (TIGR02285 family)
LAARGSASDADGIMTLMRQLLVSLLMLGAGAAHAEEITWLVADYPPIFILQDGRQPESLDELGDGSGDSIVRALIKAMPQYQHKFELANAARIWTEIGAGQPRCYPVALKTPERLKLAYMTPVGFADGVVIVTRKGALAALANGRSAISLRELLARRDLSGLFETNRSYGAAIDGILGSTAPAPNFSFAVLARTGLTLKMLGAGRMDYTLELPVVARYQSLRMENPPELDYFRIAEAKPVMVYVACTRSAWGKAVITDIDAQLQVLARGPLLSEAILRYVPEALGRTEKVKFDEFYRHRGTHTLIE